jgi:hypothetical protein
MLQAFSALLVPLRLDVLLVCLKPVDDLTEPRVDSGDTTIGATGAAAF